MSQAVLSPNLTKKFQWEVSQIADKERSLAPLYRWFKCKLKPPKNATNNKEVNQCHLSGSEREGNAEETHLSPDVQVDCVVFPK